MEHYFWPIEANNVGESGIKYLSTVGRRESQYKHCEKHFGNPYQYP